MAPLYRYLAHPVEGILNISGEGTARKTSVPAPRKANGAANMVARRRSSGTFSFPWDEALYEKLKAENEEELETFQKEEEDAEEKAGETEVQAAKGKRAEFWARVGDKACHHWTGSDFEPYTDDQCSSRRKPSPLMKPSSKRLVFSAQRSTSSLPLSASASSSATG